MAEDPRLSINELADGITRVAFLDRNILEEGIIQQIGDELEALIESKETPKLMLVFSSVEHLSSAALGTLITVNTRVKAKDGQLRLCEIDKQIHEVFIITKLNKLFEIHDTEAKALGSFK